MRNSTSLVSSQSCALSCNIQVHFVALIVFVDQISMQAKRHSEEAFIMTVVDFVTTMVGNV